MKKATCKAMRGACDQEFKGETPEEMGGKCREHVMQMVQGGDANYKAALDSMMAQSKKDQEKWYNEFRAGFASLQDA
jgi:hypothetical protein